MRCDIPALHLLSNLKISLLEIGFWIFSWFSDFMSNNLVLNEPVIFILCVLGWGVESEGISELLEYFLGFFSEYPLVLHMFLFWVFFC